MSFLMTRPKSLIYDEEKAEITTILTCESKGSTSKNLYNGHQYIAISPDGSQIVTLSTETYQLKLRESNNLTKSSIISYDAFRYVDVPSVKVNWSLAVSNKLILPDGTVDVLIAVSCFDDNDMRPHSTEDDVSVVDDMIKTIKASTWIISFGTKSRIPSSIDNIGGIVRFLDDENDNDDTSTVRVVLVNARGITRLKHRLINDSRSENRWINFFFHVFHDKSIEEFDFPLKLFTEIEGLSRDETCTFLIQQILVKGRIIVENRDKNKKVILLFNLKTNLMENIFKINTEIYGAVKSSSCFTISSNESLFAYYRGASDIIIFSMENGLEVTTKEFKEKNVHRILFLDFVQDDNKLLIVIEEERYNEVTAKIDLIPVIVVWDLFSSSDNCIRRINDTASLFPPKHEHPQRLANSSGNIFTIAEDGTIFSILKEPEIIKLLNPKSENKRTKISLDKFHITSTYLSTGTTVTDHYFIYNSSGEKLDFKSENSEGFIIKNSEPWMHDKYYKRISVYLEDKSVQLIIGESTVQVWRKRSSFTSSSTRTLEYIWTTNNTEVHRKMQIQSLEVSHKEFSLTLYIHSGISSSRRKIKLQWPEKVNVPVDACQALEFLNKKKNSGLRKQHKLDKLVQQTENIIKTCLIKKSGLWKMLDIRYDVMANLIRGNCVSIIKNILFFKSNDGKNKFMHIPRCYTWNGRTKESDLEIAIECIDGSYRKDTIVVKYLLEYYSDNAIKNVNWMFTVSKAIPLLYERQLEFYVMELFRKPCFGASEIYLERYYICSNDIIKSNYKNFHALKVRTELIKKDRGMNRKKMISLKGIESNSTSLISQVYLVPLPDFTIYPEGIDDKREDYWKIIFKLFKLLIWPRDHIIRKQEKMSPFLRMIRNERSAEIYDNPSMAAIIDFKWNAARKYFLRTVFVYYTFSLMFVLISDIVKRASKDVLVTPVDTLITILFYWLGFYLLNTERVRLKHNGLKRYFSLYNFFDLFSAILPLTVITTQIFYSVFYNTTFSINDIGTEDNLMPAYRAYTILSSFTVLTIWMEIFLLLRYFETAGTYIYILVYILQQITPFLNFILLIVLGFGHSMYVLLNHTDKIGVVPDGASYKIYDSDGNIVPEFSQYTINQAFQLNKPSDNYYSNFLRSAEAVFFWTAGRWDQLNQWDFWPIDIYSIIGSILLVTILQNMLIAIMSYAYDDAKEVGKHAVLKYRAELIADYETIEDPFGYKNENPRYIFFIGKSEYIDEWLEKSKKSRTFQEEHFDEIDENNSFHFDDDDDDDHEIGNFIHSRRASYAYSTIKRISTIDSRSNISPRKEKEVPLSLYWFVDVDKNHHKKKFLNNEPLIEIPTIQTNIINDNHQDEFKILQDKIHNIEENVKHLINLLQKQK